MFKLTDRVSAQVLEVFVIKHENIASNSVHMAIQYCHVMAYFNDL